MISLWFLIEVLKDERYGRMHTVRCALLRKPYLIKHKEVKVGVELSPKKESIVAQARFLQAVETHGAAKIAFACQVEGPGPAALRKGQSYGVAPGLTLTATYVIEGDGLAVEGGHLCKKLCKGGARV